MIIILVNVNHRIRSKIKRHALNL